MKDQGGVMMHENINKFYYEVVIKVLSGVYEKHN